MLGTAAFVAYEYWVDTRANRSGDAFSQALTLANEGKNDEALGALEQLETDGYGAYPLLARMRAATVLADKGDAAGAVASFDEVAADTSIPAAIRDMAQPARRAHPCRQRLLRRRVGPRRDADRRHQPAAPFRARGAGACPPGRKAVQPTR